MILILSSQRDGHVPRVAAKLEEQGFETLWFDTAQFPDRARMHIGFDNRGVTSRFLVWDDREYDLGRVTAVWYRRPGKPGVPASLKDTTQRYYSEWTSAHFLEGIWETLECFWVPARPAADHFAHNKLMQLAVASKLGFTIPQTLITNNPSAFLDFCEVPGKLVHKPLRDTQPKREGQYVSLYTSIVERRNAHAYQAIRYAPEIFQHYVRKQSELRVTVVGTRVFAAEIASQQSRSTRHDWRHYDDDSVKYRPVQLPSELQARCVNLLAAFQLSFGAIDLVLTPEGEYVFLEINPNGQWGWVEEWTGLPISDAMADLLSGRLQPLADS
jgi:hypothetical protein